MREGEKVLAMATVEETDGAAPTTQAEETEG